MAVTSETQVATGASRLSVIVTGGASGIGLEIVRLFASQGHMIAILDVNCTTGEEVIASLSKEFPSAALSFKWCDVSSWEGQYAVFEQTYREHGNRIDVVVANAGISEPGAGAFDCVAREFPVKPQLKMQDINLNGVMYSEYTRLINQNAELTMVQARTWRCITCKRMKLAAACQIQEDPLSAQHQLQPSTPSQSHHFTQPRSREW